MTEDLRNTIRTLLVEVLEEQGIRTSKAVAPVEERVRIKTDADLAAFVSRVLDLATDSKVHAEIRSGRRIFRLSDPLIAPSDISYNRSREAAVSERGRTKAFESGLITERQIQDLPADVGIVRIGPDVRITPLASDAIRQAGIKIKRVKSS